MTDPQTISPDDLPPITAATDVTQAIVFQPGGGLGRMPFGALLARLVATDLTKGTAALLATDIAYPSGSVALVYDDPLATRNGWWRKIGASGAGSWVQFDTLSLTARQLAEAAAEAAELSARSAASVVAVAEALVGPMYATIGAGLAATTDSQYFAVDPGTGIVGIYRNTAGGAVLQRMMATTAALAGTGAGQGSNLIGFLASGIGAIARLLQDKAREVVSVKDYGAVGNNEADDTEAIRKAVAAIISRGGGSLYFPAGAYKVSGTIELGNRIRLFGEGFKSSIRPTISDGSAVFSWPSASDFFSVEDLEVNSKIDFAAYIAGGAAQNCTGFKHNGPGYASRFFYKNVNCYGLAKGWDVTGFIGTMDNVWAQCCDIGLYGNAFNSIRLNLRCENNKKPYELVNSAAVQFDQLIDEGGHSAPLAGTIDQGCSGITFISPYWEQTTNATRGAPYLSIGATAECRGIRIFGMHIVDYLAAGVPMISADMVDGLDVAGNAFRSRYAGPTVSTTANTKNFRQNIYSNSAANASPWLTDGSAQQGACFNYFPNRNFDLWFRGWSEVAPVRAAITKETSVVRKGVNAVKITATAGNTYSYALWRLTGSALTALRGKMVMVGAWVFVPDIVEFSNNPSSRTKFPSISLDSYNGTVTVSSASRNGRASKGGWQFMWTQVAVQSDATQLNISLHANQGSAIATGNEYIIVDSIVVTEASTPFERFINDSLQDSPMITSIGVGGKMVMRGISAPSDADQIYEVGDQVWNDVAAPSTTPGWICTSAGAGGAAVFKAMANLTA